MLENGWNDIYGPERDELAYDVLAAEAALAEAYAGDGIETEWLDMDEYEQSWLVEADVEWEDAANA